MDDIVTQLRLQADVVNGKDYHTISGGLHLDAADEIERLRDELLDMTIDRDAWRNLTKLTWEKMAEKNGL